MQEMISLKTYNDCVAVVVVACGVATYYSEDLVAELKMSIKRQINNKHKEARYSAC
jgi:hypothetical protein